MIQAVISKSQHPEYGAVTIPFPIPREEYDHVIEMMEAMGIGDVRENREAPFGSRRAKAADIR